VTKAESFANSKNHGPFSIPEFQRFFAGQSLSYLGDGLRTLAIPLIVYHLTGSATSIGITLGLQTLPYGIMAIIGGSLSDRVDRKTIMMACDFSRFVIMAMLCLAYYTHGLGIALLYLGVFLLSVAGAIFNGCQTPSIPFLVGRKNTKSAISIMQTTEQTVGLIAPPLGGTILGLMGPLPALILDACTYLGSQISLASVKTFGPNKPTGFPKVTEIKSDVILGWNTLKNDSALKIVTLSSTILSSTYLLIAVNIVPLLKKEYGATDQSIGFAYGVMAIGAVLGSFLAGRTRTPFGKTTLYLNYVDALPWVVIALVHNFWITVACITVSNMANSFKFVNTIAWRLRIIPAERFGRVFGVMRSITVPGMFFGGLIGGMMDDHLGPQKAIGIGITIYLAWSTRMWFFRDLRLEDR